MNVERCKARLKQFFEDIAVLQHYQRLSANMAKETTRGPQKKENGLTNLDSETRKVFGTSIVCLAVLTCVRKVPILACLPNLESQDGITGRLPCR